MRESSSASTVCSDSGEYTFAADRRDRCPGLTRPNVPSRVRPLPVPSGPTIEEVSMPGSRRQFIAATAGGLAGILAARIPPALGQTREISYLCWNNFAPLSDKKLAEIGPRFTKDTGIKIRINHIAAPQQAAKYASEVQTQAGHDLVEMRMHVPWHYEPQLVDVSDIVTNREKSYYQD